MTCMVLHGVRYTRSMQVSPDEVKAAWLEAHSRVFEQTVRVREKRWQYEAHLKRRWWNYKPLEAEQLLTWWLFLDEVEAEGNETATYGLFERCLVPCASYPGAGPPMRPLEALPRSRIACRV